jgi:hypothetical protein
MSTVVVERVKSYMIAEELRMFVAVMQARLPADKDSRVHACRHVPEGGVHFELYIPCIAYFDLIFDRPLMGLPSSVRSSYLT